LTTILRCSAASLGRHEALWGTASTVKAFLLVEAPGPWGVDAVRDCRLFEGHSARLLQRAHACGVRVLLVRRHGRHTPAGLRVFAAYADAERPWVETATLAEPADVLGLDLPALGAGRSAGLEPHDRPLFCVCTHGRHDACCAEQGRPVAAALAASYPDLTWEVSHIGGDRFAGNVLVLPEGLYYGRVTAATAPELAAEHLSGRLDLERLRGRSSRPMLVQAAESMLRGRLGVREVYAVRPVGRRRLSSDGLAHEDAVDFAVDGEGTTDHWRVVLRTSPGEATLLTCRAGSPNPPPTYTEIGIGPVPGTD
jgi:hypothetical protein